MVGSQNSIPKRDASFLAAGAVINATGAHTLRFLPPLVCEEADVDSLIEILSGVLG